MPIYEYECTQCGRIEEALQHFSDKPLSKCQFCSGKLQKLISQTTFHLKGSGWYVTDYASKNKDSAPSKAKITNSKTKNVSKKSSTASDSKKTVD